MKDFRCINCNRLLAKVKSGEIQIKCPHCRTMNEWNQPSKQQLKRKSL
ncbi:Com family DNA-binding transcriptional regulator [Gordoniibacillus kamchatkensis]